MTCIQRAHSLWAFSKETSGGEPFQRLRGTWLKMLQGPTRLTPARLTATNLWCTSRAYEASGQCSKSRGFSPTQTVSAPEPHRQSSIMQLCLTSEASGLSVLYLPCTLFVGPNARAGTLIWPNDDWSAEVVLMMRCCEVVGGTQSFNGHNDERQVGRPLCNDVSHAATTVLTSQRSRRPAARCPQRWPEIPGLVSFWCSKKLPASLPSGHCNPSDRPHWPARVIIVQVWVAVMASVLDLANKCRSMRIAIRSLGFLNTDSINISVSTTRTVFECPHLDGIEADIHRRWEDASVQRTRKDHCGISVLTIPTMRKFTRRYLSMRGLSEADWSECTVPRPSHKQHCTPTS